MDTTPDEQIAAFTRLFRGRADAYGAWNGAAIREPLTTDHFRKHLTSNAADNWIGVYPHLGASSDNHVSWGCIDIDGADFPKHGARDNPDYNRKEPLWHDWPAMAELAYNLAASLKFKKVNAWTEATRNGIHVWVFPEDGLVPAATMRRALMAACQVCDYSPKEVNPKQETLPPGKLGNYVRLPYPAALIDPYEWEERYFFPWDDPDGCHPHGLGRYNLQTFLAHVTTTTTKALEDVARLWTPPTVEHIIDVNAGLEAEQYLPMLGGLAYTIWKDGPLPGKDRSSTLVQLAHIIHEEGLPEQVAFIIVKSADERHGRKFADREDGMEQIQNIIERVYAQ